MEGSFAGVTRDVMTIRIDVNLNAREGAERRDHWRRNLEPENVHGRVLVLFQRLEREALVLLGVARSDGK